MLIVVTSQRSRILSSERAVVVLDLVRCYRVLVGELFDLRRLLAVPSDHRGVRHLVWCSYLRTEHSRAIVITSIVGCCWASIHRSCMLSALDVLR